jgi:hypothetical protein
VTYTNGHTYICKAAHTSSASITPGNTTYWDDKTIGDMIYSLNSNYAKIPGLFVETSSFHVAQSQFSGSGSKTLTYTPTINCLVHMWSFTRNGVTVSGKIADITRYNVDFRGIGDACVSCGDYYVKANQTVTMTISDAANGGFSMTFYKLS